MIEFPLLSQPTIDAVQAEALRAHVKHGSKGKSLLNPDMPILEKLAALGEEYGEVCRALTYDQDHAGPLVKELLQLANLALSWAESIEGANRERFRQGASWAFNVSIMDDPLSIIRTLEPRHCLNNEVHNEHGWGETVGTTTRGYYCEGRRTKARPIKDNPQG